jgi:hypothetical protein
LDALAEALSIDERLFKPAADDSSLRRDRLVNLRRAAGTLSRNLGMLDADKKVLLRQQLRANGDPSAWPTVDPAEFNNALDGIQWQAAALAELVSAFLARSSKKSNRARPRRRDPSDALLIMILGAFRKTTGRRAGYSRDSRFFRLLSIILEILGRP